MCKVIYIEYLTIDKEHYESGTFTLKKADYEVPGIPPQVGYAVSEKTIQVEKTDMKILSRNMGKSFDAAVNETGVEKLENDKVLVDKTIRTITIRYNVNTSLDGYIDITKFVPAEYTYQNETVPNSITSAFCYSENRNEMLNNGGKVTFKLLEDKNKKNNVKPLYRDSMMDKNGYGSEDAKLAFIPKVKYIRLPTQEMTEEFIFASREGKPEIRIKLVPTSETIISCKYKKK